MLKFTKKLAHAPYYSAAQLLSLSEISVTFNGHPMDNLLSIGLMPFGVFWNIVFRVKIDQHRVRFQALKTVCITLRMKIPLPSLLSNTVALQFK